MNRFDFIEPDGFNCVLQEISIIWVVLGVVVVFLSNLEQKQISKLWHFLQNGSCGSHIAMLFGGGETEELVSNRQE